MLHIPHGTVHIRIPLCTRTVSHHGPWNSLVLYFGGTIGVQWAVDSAIRIKFYKLLSVHVKLYTPHMPKFYMPTFGNHRNNSKTAPISHYLVRHPLGKPRFRWCIHAILSGINTWRVITGYLVCSTFELASCMWPISLLTNRPCHRPWTGLGDSGTVWPCRPCINQPR